MSRDMAQMGWCIGGLSAVSSSVPRGESVAQSSPPLRPGGVPRVLVSLVRVACRSSHALQAISAVMPALNCGGLLVCSTTATSKVWRHALLSQSCCAVPCAVHFRESATFDSLLTPPISVASVPIKQLA